MKLRHTAPLVILCAIAAQGVMSGAAAQDVAVSWLTP